VLVTVFRDGEDGKPIGFETTSDAKGGFRFFDLAPGLWKFHLEVPGYYPYRTTEEIKTGEVLAVKYFVEKGSYNPFDVTVVAPRPKKEVSRTVVSAQEIEHVPGTFGDPLNVLQNFPGVARTGGLLGGLLVVRGSLPQDTRFAVDGTDVPIVYHFDNLRSVLPLGMIDSWSSTPGTFRRTTVAPSAAPSTSRSKGCSPRRSAATPISAFSTAVSISKRLLAAKRPSPSRAGAATSTRSSRPWELRAEHHLRLLPACQEAQRGFLSDPHAARAVHAWCHGRHRQLPRRAASRVLDGGLGGNQLDLQGAEAYEEKQTGFAKRRRLTAARRAPSSTTERRPGVTQVADARG